MPKRGEQLHPITGCRAESNLFASPWLMDAVTLQSLCDQVSVIDLKDIAEHNKSLQISSEPKDGEEPKEPEKPYLVDGGVAVLEISGPLTKHPTSFQSLLGGTSTVKVQRAISLALADEQVNSILLKIDSPGGNAAGTFDLANAIKKADSKKPVVAQAEDMATSGAQLLASQARYTFANENAQMGSIGVISGLIDESEVAKKQGVRVIPIFSGKEKPIGVRGAPVKPEHIEAVQRRSDEIHDLFTRKVAEGRGLTQEAVKGLEAAVMIASKAKEIGLIDGVQSYEDTLAAMKAGKFSEPVVRSPGAENKTKTADAGDHPARSTTMLKPEQIAAAALLPGGAGITAENADEKLFQMATEMAVKLQSAPQPMPKQMAAGYLSLFMKGAELQVREGKITAAQAKVLENCLYPNGQDKDGNYSLVQPDGKILIPAEVMEKVFAENKPNGLTEEKTASQAVHRQEPGAASGTVKVTFESVNRARETNGLAPLTREQFNQAFPQN